jgi:hypothetical protein
MKELKAKEVAQILDKCSALFKLLPDLELPTALDVIIQIVKDSMINSSTSLESRTSYESASPLSSLTSRNSSSSHLEWDDLLKKLENTPTEEIEPAVRSSIAWKNVKTLKSLLQQLHIPTKSSDKKEDLLQKVVSHYETRRMHVLIRTTQSEHSNV